MVGFKYLRVFFILFVALFFVMCKNQEQMAPPSPKPTAESPTSSKPATELREPPKTPCGKLTHSLSKDELAFAAKADAKTQKIAIQRAETKASIELVQFFQSEFIEGGQVDLFRDNTSGMSGKNEEFLKEWAEVSFEMIGSEHNHNGFTHKQKVMKDSNGVFTVYNVLVISDDWIRNHWKESLAATDSSFYKMITRRNLDEKIMNMDVHQQPPCSYF